MPQWIKTPSFPFVYQAGVVCFDNDSQLSEYGPDEITLLISRKYWLNGIYITLSYCLRWQTRRRPPAATGLSTKRRTMKSSLIIISILTMLIQKRLPYGANSGQRGFKTSVRLFIFRCSSKWRYRIVLIIIGSRLDLRRTNFNTKVRFDHINLHYRFEWSSDFRMFYPGSERSGPFAPP